MKIFSVILMCVGAYFMTLHLVGIVISMCVGANPDPVVKDLNNLTLQIIGLKGLGYIIAGLLFRPTNGK